MEQPQILVLGGGIGGLAVSSLLKEKLKDQANVKLVERKTHFQFPPAYPWLMLGKRTPDQIQRNISSLQRKGIETLQGEVLEINPQRHEVHVNSTSLSYDYLIITLGAQYAPERIPGLQENSQHCYDLDSAIKCRKALEEFDGGTIAVGISSLPFKCPAAPYESALLIEDYMRQKGLNERVKIQFFTPEGLPLPSAGPEIGNGTFELLKSRGIDTKFKAKLKEVKPNQAIFEDGSTIPYDLLIAVPPHKCPPPVEKAGLTDQSGWIPVEPTTMRTKVENVYALGDVASVPTPSGYVPFLPKAGVFAHRASEIVANNLAVKITQQGREKAWDGSGACFLMTGQGKAAFVKGTWFSQPHPDIKFHSPSRIWYMQRALFEKYWMHHWF